MKPDKAILCHKSYGICFGNALCAYEEPYNGINACWSNPNQSSYERIGVASGGASDLTQTTKDEYKSYYDFTISELEVWEVAFE